MLLVGHGKRCSRCAANGRPRYAPDGPCPLFPAKGSASGSAAKSPHNSPASAAKGRSPAGSLLTEPKREGGVAGNGDVDEAKPKAENVALKVEVKIERGVAVKGEGKVGGDRGALKEGAAAESTGRVVSSGAEHYADLYKSAVKEEPGAEAEHVPAAGGSAGAVAARALRVGMKPGSAEKPRRTRVKVEHVGG